MLPAFLVVAATAFGVLTLLPPVHSLAQCDEFFYLVHSHFTLHGLWPNYEKGQCPGKRGAWPQNCDDSSTDLPPECDCPFDLSLLSDLQSSMLVNWPSYGQRNALFWKHEWDKHGSCAITYEQEIGGPVTSQHDYFDKALQLREQCNVLDSLKAGGISPGGTAPPGDFLAAVKEGCGVSPQIACHPGSSDVEEFRFCYDDEFQAMDCQQGKEVEGCHGDDITLPAWQNTSTAVA